MGYTLCDIAYRVARELGVAVEGTVTETVVTKDRIVDEIFLKNRFADDYFVAGTCVQPYKSAYSDATPKSEWARVTDFDEATGTLTITGFYDPVIVGNRYCVWNAEYTIDTIIMCTNMVLSEIQIPIVDILTIETAQDKTEYTLPAELLDERIKVWTQRSETVDHNLWIENYDWYIAETETGTAKKLIFRSQPQEPWIVKIEYWIPHPEIMVSTSTIRESINISRVVAEVALKCLIWKKAQKAVDDPVLDARIAEFMQRVSVLRYKHPNKKSEVKLATYGITNNYDNAGDEYEWE